MSAGAMTLAVAGAWWLASFLALASLAATAPDAVRPALRTTAALFPVAVGLALLTALGGPHHA
ncbi:hypothetical protein [Streptomyces sp. NPDC048644]|uniref:hypothetical protein n=1 Tax=Streptomyces sp. NPDC048644 TaxID=3365582 RepID=UPI0037114DBC